MTLNMKHTLHRTALALALSVWGIAAHAAQPDPYSALRDYATELGGNDVCKGLGTDDTPAIEAWMVATIAWRRSLHAVARSPRAADRAEETEVIEAHEQRRYPPEVREQARQAFAAQDEATQRRACATRKATLDRKREFMNMLTGGAGDTTAGQEIPWRQPIPLRGDNAAP